MDRYFRTQVGQDSHKRVASCFVLVGADNIVAGYYTLSATSVLLTELPPDVTKKLPRYPAAPATLMGRLAIDEQYRRQSLGELMLFDAFSRTLRSGIASYAFVVEAKDDGAQAFFEHYRFMRLSSTARRLFLPVGEIAALFA